MSHTSTQAALSSRSKALRQPQNPLHARARRKRSETGCRVRTAPQRKLHPIILTRRKSAAIREEGADGDTSTNVVKCWCPLISVQVSNQLDVRTQQVFCLRGRTALTISARSLKDILSRTLTNGRNLGCSTGSAPDTTHCAWILPRKETDWRPDLVVYSLRV